MRRFRFLLPVLMLLVAAPPALGQRAPETAPSAASDELERLHAEHREARLRARRLRADAEETSADLSRLDRDLARLDLEDARDTAAVSAQRERLATLNEREVLLLGELSDERARQGRLLSALQMMSRRPPPPLLIPAERAVDTVRAAILIKAMAPEIEVRAARIGERQAEIARIRRRVAVASEALFTLESAHLERRAGIDSMRTQRRNLAAVLRADAGRAEEAARAIEARIRALGGEPRPLEPGAAPASVASASPGGRARLTPPVAGAPVRRYSAEQRGWLWRVDGGEEVRAPASAAVEHAGPLDGWGEVVILNLGPGWRVVLAGLGEVEVAAGDQVGDGQALGRLPDGLEAELYFELRREDRAVDPASWLP